MLQKVKDLKRRGVEGFLETLGASDRTVDAEFEEMKQHFDQMFEDLNDLGSGMSEFLTKAREFYKLTVDVSEVVDRYYNGVYNRPWENAPNTLRQHEAIAQAREHWDFVNDVVRRSMATVWVERALDPVRAMMTIAFPDLLQQIQERNQICTDFDSYRRRLANLEAAHPKIPAAEQQRLQKNEADQVELRAKLERARQSYEEANARCKDDIMKAKLARDELIEVAAISVLVCQAELMRFSAGRLDDIIANINKTGHVEQIRARMRQLISQGGPDKRPVEPSLMNKAFLLATGKKVLSDFSTSPEQLQQEQLAEQRRIDAATRLLESDSRGGGSSSPSPRGGAYVPAATNYASRAAPRPPAAPSSSPPRPPGAPSGRPPAPPTSAAPPAPARGAPPPPRSAPPPPQAKQRPASPLRRMFGGGSTPTPPAPTPTRAPPPAPSSSPPRPGGVAAIASRFGQPQPASNSPPPPTSRAPPPPRPVAASRNFATALYDNEPDDADELGFSVGDKIEVLQQDASGWWKGRLRGKEGIFPANFVRLD